MAAECADKGESHPFLQEYMDSSTSSEDILMEGVQAPSHVPCSWQDQLESILGEVRVKELPGRVCHDILCALPETVCVLDAPRHPSSMKGASVMLPEQGAAAALQAKLLGVAADATGYLLVPHCHPAVTHVQLALACCQVLVQLANEIKSLANPYGPGCPVLRAPLENMQRVVLDLLNEVMTRASECLSNECPGSVWEGVLLGEDHAAAILQWVADLDIVREVPLPQPTWRQGDLLCVADDVVQHSDKYEVLCFRHLMDAACGELTRTHLPDLLGLRATLRLPRVPLNWMVQHPSEYKIRPSRALLHVLCERSDNLRVCVASREVCLGRDIPRSTAGNPGAMFMHVISRYGVDDWLKRTPFSMKTAMLGTPLLYLDLAERETSASWGKEADVEGDGDRDPSAPSFQEDYARFMVMRSRCALIMVDLHWETVLISEESRDPTHQASAESTLCDGGCEIQ